MIQDSLEHGSVILADVTLNFGWKHPNMTLFVSGWQITLIRPDMYGSHQ